jgi:hypothetical protein
MILRKFRLGAVIVSLALLLSACVEVKGDVSVNSAARFTGEIIYSLDKSLASAAGVASLADLNSVSGSSEELGFCKDVPFTEDSSNYIIKCALKDTVSETGDITASLVGNNIVFRYKANLDATSDQTDFGSVSLTVRFLDPVTSIKENKVGLVKTVDSLTYRISGYATELMDIEITANCSSRCGLTNLVPVPEPTKTASPTDASNAAIDAANKAADAAAADLRAKQEAVAKAAADLKAQQEADAKAASDLKAQQEAAEKAVADKAAEDLKAAAAKVAAELKAAAEKIAADKSVAELKAAAEKAAADLKAKIAADKTAADLKAAADKAAAELKAVAEKAALDLKAAADKAAAEKVLADAKASAAKILAAAKAKAAAALKKTTITCVKGKTSKKVTAGNPKCPAGYKKK